MIASFIYTLNNRYQDDSVVLNKLIGTNGLIVQSQIQTTLDNLGATFISSNALVTAPYTIQATIQIQLSSDFVAMYPTDADKNVMLSGLFQGMISTGLPCVNVTELITYV